MNFLVLFCSPEYCEAKGIELAWHAHRLFDDRAEAEACAATLERVGCLGRVCRLVPLDAARDASGRFRKRAALRVVSEAIRDNPVAAMLPGTASEHSDGEVRVLAP